MTTAETARRFYYEPGDVVVDDEGGRPFDPVKTPRHLDDDPLDAIYAELGKRSVARALGNVRHNQPGDHPLHTVGGKEWSPAATAEGAAAAMKSLGVEYVKLGEGATVEIANDVSRGLFDLAAVGHTMPPRVVIDKTLFRSPSVVGEFNPTTMNVAFNPGANYWEDPVQNSYLLNATNFWSSDHPRAITYHEVGHYEHYRTIGDDRWSEIAHSGVRPYDYPAMAKDVQGKVSGYAMTSPFEFVAEVFAGTMAGNKYPPKVMKWYRELEGPSLTPKKAKTS